MLRDARGVPQIYADRPTDLVPRPGLRARPGPLLRDGLAAARHGRAALRARRPERGRAARRQGRPHPRAGAGSPSRRAAAPGRAGDPRVPPRLRRRGQRLHLDPVAAQLSLRVHRSSGCRCRPTAIEPWTAGDSLAWLKAMAWDLRGNYDRRARPGAGLRRRPDVAQRRPALPAPTPTPTTRRSSSRATSAPVRRRRRTAHGPGAATRDAGQDVAAALAGLGRRAARSRPRTARAGVVPDLLGRRRRHRLELLGRLRRGHRHRASRCWPTTRTCRRACRASGTRPGCTAAQRRARGARSTSPASPSPASRASSSGTTGTVAWGFTNLGPDVTDFYLERIRGDTYQRDGEQVPLQSRTETIRVAGGADPVPLTVRATVHGPLLCDVLDPVRHAGASAPAAASRTAAAYAVSLAWTALTPGTHGRRALRGRHRHGLRRVPAAAPRFAVPAQNLVYADTSTGHIGYQAPGRIPFRHVRACRTPAPRRTGRCPAGTRATTGRASSPSSQLPWTYDPPEGFIVTANQAVTAEHAPVPHHRLGLRLPGPADPRPGSTARDKVQPGATWRRSRSTPATRRLRLVEALLEPSCSPTTTDPDAVHRARRRTCCAAGTAPSPPALRSAAAAAYFNAVWSRAARPDLRRRAARRTSRPTAAAGGCEAVTSCSTNPHDPWWDDKQTAGVIEGRDEILRAGPGRGPARPDPAAGQGPAALDLGPLHQLPCATRCSAATGAVPRPPPALAVQPRALRACPAGRPSSTPTATTPARAFEVDWAPSMRMVVDLADLDRSRWVNQTGAAATPSTRTTPTSSAPGSTGRSSPGRSPRPP